MQSLSVCALVVLSLASLALAAPFPCTFDNGGTKYDLSNMYRDPSKGQTDFNTVFTDGSTFNVNVCGQAASTLCSPANGVCQVTTGNPPAGYGNGDASKATWAAYPGDAQGVQLTYPTGSGATCPGGVMRKSILNIKCDSSANDGVIDSMSESMTPPCTYTINMRSKWACPGKNGGGGGGGGGSGGLSPGGGGGGGGSGGLSPGSIILITVACVIPVYLVVGGIIKWKVYGAEPLSIDIIPNVDFWTALPFLVKDGSVYFVRKVTFNKVCGEYSEI